MAVMTLASASSQDFLKPACALHLLHHEMSARPKFAFAIQFRTEEEPRKEITMREFVVSTATKPVESVFMELVWVSMRLRIEVVGKAGNGRW